MNELKVGILAICAIASLVYMSVRVTQNKPGFGNYLTYRTIVADAAGIFPKTAIKVAGINAGKIKSIELVGQQALITFELLDGIKLTKNSVLRIKSVGFLGDKYLEIALGDFKDNRLEENSLIPSHVGGGMEDLTKDASEVMSDLKEVIKNIKNTLSPDGKSGPLKNILSNLESATKNANKTLEAFTANNRIDHIMSNIDKLTESLAKHTGDGEGSLMTDLKKIGPVLDKAQKAMDDLNIVLEDVRKGKGTIGKLLRDDEIIDKVSETLSGVNKLVNKVNSIQTGLSLYSGINSDDGNVSMVNLDLYPSPERFYRLGIVTSEIGPSTEKEIEETQNGVTTRVTRKETSKNTYNFNAQIGRKVQSWGFRAGMIESTGGIGVDYFFQKQGSIFTFELFDYRKSLGPNVRLLVELHLWNVFYARAAGEDLISQEGEQSFTIGAGLKFTDEDLKGLLGFFI